MNSSTEPVAKAMMFRAMESNPTAIPMIGTILEVVYLSGFFWIWESPIVQRTNPTKLSGGQQRITERIRPTMESVLLWAPVYGTPGMAGAPVCGIGGGTATRNASANSGKVESGFQGEPSKLAIV